MLGLILKTYPLELCPNGELHMVQSTHVQYLEHYTVQKDIFCEWNYNTHLT